MSGSLIVVDGHSINLCSHRSTCSGPNKCLLDSSNCRKLRFFGYLSRHHITQKHAPQVSRGCLEALTTSKKHPYNPESLAEFDYHTKILCTCLGKNDRSGVPRNQPTTTARVLHLESKICFKKREFDLTHRISEFSQVAVSFSFLNNGLMSSVCYATKSSEFLHQVRRVPRLHSFAAGHDQNVTEVVRNPQAHEANAIALLGQGLLQRKEAEGHQFLVCLEFLIYT